MLRAHAIRLGEVRNPEGKNGSAAQRFRRIFEEEATDDELRKLARACFKPGRLREMMVDRLLPPKTDRLEVGSIGDSDAMEREAARSRLAQLMSRRESPPAPLQDPHGGGGAGAGDRDEHAGRTPAQEGTT